jgi:DnaJ-class molecular chaperone
MEPICPACNGSGVIQLEISKGKGKLCEISIFEHSACPTCDGSGIATEDEVKEFINYMKEE